MGKRVRVLGDVVSGGTPTVEVDITRTGVFSDPRYGRFEINRAMLETMVKNFDTGVYGQKILADLAHKPEDGAAGEFTSLRVACGGGDRCVLRGKLELTPYGVGAVKERGYVYLSAEYHENYRDNETGTEHGPTLLGAALTTRPVIKRLSPIQLAEPETGDTPPILVMPRVIQSLKSTETHMNKYLLALREHLAAISLAESDAGGLVETLGKVLEASEESEHESMLEQFKAAASSLKKTLSETRGPVTLSLNLERSAPPSAVDVEALVVKRLDELAAERAQAERALSEKAATNQALYRKILDETGTGLPSAMLDALRGDATKLDGKCDEAEVRRLAERAVEFATQAVVAAKLSGLGFEQKPAGGVHVEVSHTNELKELQEHIDRCIGLTDMPDSKRYAHGRVDPAARQFAGEVLNKFDALNERVLLAEHEEWKRRRLSAGSTTVSDMSVPAIYERTVIREALHQLTGMSFVNSGVIAKAPSWVVPYQYRDPTAAGNRSTRKYEGQAIERSGVIQASETAYPIPQKLAFEVSDETRLLANSGIDWDAAQDNMLNAARIIAEDTDTLIWNEILQANDEYAAVAVTAENLEVQADDAKTVFVLGHFPVCRPRKIYDMQGTQIGSTGNPITVTYNSVVRNEYDGTGTQSAGTYYVLDYNLGEIYLVNQAGVVQVPANGTAYTVSYSYTTNVYAWDTDLGSLTTKAKWDNFLYHFGQRKALLKTERYHMATFGLMTETVMNQAAQAESFGANYLRPGTDLSADGNLGRIKTVPMFDFVAPGVSMGDQRILLGERNLTRFRMMEPWSMGALENQKDSTGKFTGKKTAYGSQWIGLHTPTPFKRATTSLVLYSGSGRVAR